jgi:hypothetical protein
LCHGGRPDLYGEPAPLTAATRTITISLATHLVNVRDYETIKFMVDSDAFAWRFDTAPRLGQLYLDWIAPPGLLKHQVWIFVMTDPRKTDR